jgi:cytochrome P450
MQRLQQSPTDPGFVQNPYPFYDRARAAGDLVWWEDYGTVCATSYAAVMALLKDRRLGREVPEGHGQPIPDRLRPFYDIEAHSMLELEPPRHTRLRSLVLRAFTSRRVMGLRDEVEALAHRLIDEFPEGDFDLLPAYCQRIPVIVICRLLGVPETMADTLLEWSSAMVAMYQAGRTQEVEARAMAASTDFADFLRGYIDDRRGRPGEDLITQLIAAEEEGEKLTTDELISTCILLLNAGHEATVHAMGNAVKLLLERDHRHVDEDVVEECLRLDPPLHIFDRWVYEDVTLFGHHFRRGDSVKCILGAANRCPDTFEDPARFDPKRDGVLSTSFGGGIHFCVGAPLARMELLLGLRVLFARCPSLALAAPPRYADVYHFHGLERLVVSCNTA